MKFVAVLTYSNVSTVKVTIKLIVLTVCFGSIDLIGNGTARKCKSSEKSELTQFAYLWAEVNHDSEISQLFLQNICKNKLLTDTILEKNNKNFDILFIQEPPWLVICQILSSISEEGSDLIGAPHYPFWIMFVRSTNSDSNYPRIITYINIKLISLHFLIRKDIFNHYNINLIFFFN